MKEESQRGLIQENIPSWNMVKEKTMCQQSPPGFCDLKWIFKHPGDSDQVSC